MYVQKEFKFVTEKDTPYFTMTTPEFLLAITNPSHPFMKLIQNQCTTRSEVADAFSDYAKTLPIEKQVFFNSIDVSNFELMNDYPLSNKYLQEMDIKAYLEYESYREQQKKLQRSEKVLDTTAKVTTKTTTTNQSCSSGAPLEEEKQKKLLKMLSGMSTGFGSLS